MSEHNNESGYNWLEWIIFAGIIFYVSSSTDDRIDDLENEISSQEYQISDLEDKVKELEERVDSLERDMRFRK